MSQHAALIARLCEASEGSLSLSIQWWEAMTGRRPEPAWNSLDPLWYCDINGAIERVVPCLTTDLSAAWEEAERRGLRPSVMARAEGCKPPYFADVIGASGRQWSAFGNAPALALCAAMLAAEGERS
jgi:hypothetical protein